MDSPSVRVETETENGAEHIIRTFMVEQGRLRPGSARRNSVVDQIFRGDGRVLSDVTTPNSDVGLQLAGYASQLNQFYARETDQYIQTLEEHPENRMMNLNRIIHGVFQHGITAGHVMSLLLFGYRYIHHIVNSGLNGAESICKQIIDKIINYVKHYVANWVQSIGGWNGFLEEVKVFARDKAAFWSRYKPELWLASLAFLTAVNVGAIAYFLRK